MFRDVVRWSTLDSFVTSLHLQQMTIGDTRVEAESLVTQLLVQENNQLFCLFAGDVSGRVVDQLFSLNADQVATHGQLTGVYLHPHTGCFQYPSSLEHGRQVITQH